MLLEMDFSKNIVFLCSLLLSTLVYAELSPWEDYVEPAKKDSKQITHKSTYQKARKLILDEQIMKNILVDLPFEKKRKVKKRKKLSCKTAEFTITKRFNAFGKFYYRANSS